MKNETHQIKKNHFYQPGWIFEWTLAAMNSLVMTSLSSTWRCTWARRELRKLMCTCVRKRTHIGAKSKAAPDATPNHIFNFNIASLCLWFRILTFKKRRQSDRKKRIWTDCCVPRRHCLRFYYHFYCDKLYCFIAQPQFFTEAAHSTLRHTTAIIIDHKHFPTLYMTLPVSSCISLHIFKTGMAILSYEKYCVERCWR